jgi:hypothetical protein
MGPENSDYHNQNTLFCLQDKQNKSYAFKTPLDEDSIIFFQKLFLIPHVHYIKMHALSKQRSQFLRLLTSVHGQSHTQYVAQKNLILPDHENMYTHFICIQCGDTHYRFDQYWLEYGKAQVVWIEMTPDASFEYIKNCTDIITVLSSQEIPVLVVEESLD